jgi:hypothetical protein
MITNRSQVRVATWECFFHGSQEVWCCERTRPRYSLPRGQTLGAIPLARRIDVRHELQLLHSECLELRQSIIIDHWSSELTRQEIDRMIGTLQKCKKMLT